MRELKIKDSIEISPKAQTYQKTTSYGQILNSLTLTYPAWAWVNNPYRQVDP